MKKSIIHSQHKLPIGKDETYQEFGELQFYPNGSVRLGPMFYAYGTPIHRHRFGANLVACRNVYEPKTLDLETPFGAHLQFYYSPFFRAWYQLVEVDDPRLYLHQERYGSLIAIGLYYVRWGTRWAFIKTIHLLLVVLALGTLFLIANLLTKT